MDVGDVVEDFELPDEDGVPRRLTTFLESGPVVLFFYPAAMTAGCTAESCHFRDVGSDFEAVGAQRVGISPDRVEKQKQFSDKHQFDFPLLSDADRNVATQFGVKRGWGPTPVKRVTFVIDTDRRVLARIASELRMSTHADQALKVLKDRHGSGAASA